MADGDWKLPWTGACRCGQLRVRATALDDARWARPFVEVFTSEKLPWATTPAVHSYATAPALEDYQALIAEFLATAERPA
jgi:hypothetical protein